MNFVTYGRGLYSLFRVGESVHCQIVKNVTFWMGKKNNNLPGGESNPGLPRDRRGY